MKCKPNCAPGGALSKTRLASCSGGILAGSTGDYWRAAPAEYWPDTRQDSPAKVLSRILGGIHWRATLGYSTGYSAGSTFGLLAAGSTGELLWDTQRDTWRDPLRVAGRSGGILGGIHWRALWRDTRCGGILGGIHWQAALAGYWAGSTRKPLWQDTRRDPLASCSGGILILGGIHWRALAGYWVGAWCRSIANADSNVTSNNPFLSSGE